MKDKYKIEIEHKKKIQNLKKHNKYYFIEDSPKINDSDYDKLKKDIKELEKKYPYLKKKFSRQNCRRFSFKQI